MGSQVSLFVHFRTRRRITQVSDAGDAFQSLFAIELTALEFTVDRLRWTNSAGGMGDK